MNDAPIVDGGQRGHQCLPEHLAAKHLRATCIAALTAKQVHLKTFELELLLEVGEPHPNLNAPFIMVEWPGKVQKKLYASPFLRADVANFTVAVWPPPTTLVCANTRASPFLM